MKNLICFLFSCASFAQAGSFDATYGNNGVATICYPSGVNMGTFTASFQSSGKLVTYDVVGNQDVATLMRWNTNGSIDATFGDSGTGIKTYSHSPPFVNGGYYPYDMAIQADDKILIMGLQQNPTYSNAYWVARLLPNGALDTSFNGTGYLDLSFGTAQDRGTCIAVQNDGKILVGGTSGSTAQYFTVARLNTNGSSDSSFGINGAVQTPFSGAESFVQHIAVQPDGKIILGGYTVNLPHAKDFALIRYNTDGSIDTGFGINGKVITTISDNSDLVTDLIVQSDGKILAGGYTSSENNPWMCMVRYLADGSIDTSFGVNGIVINNDDNSRNCSMARQVDGKYLMAGCRDGIYFLVIRYNSDGTKDSNFGTTGVVNAFPVTYGSASKVLIQSDNKIVACGHTYNSDFTEGCFANVRLNPGTLSVTEFSNINLELSPNPSHGIFQLYFDSALSEKAVYTVYDMLGKKLIESELLEGVMGAEIDLEKYSQGIYLLSVTIGNSTVSKKMVKE